MFSPHEVLGLEPEAPEAEIKKAYRKLVLEHHPDKNPDEPEAAAERFKDVQKAYEILTDPEKAAEFRQEQEKEQRAQGRQEREQAKQERQRAREEWQREKEERQRVREDREQARKERHRATSYPSPPAPEPAQRAGKAKQPADGADERAERCEPGFTDRDERGRRREHCNRRHPAEHQDPKVYFHYRRPQAEHQEPKEHFTREDFARGPSTPLGARSPPPQRRPQSPPGQARARRPSIPLRKRGPPPYRPRNTPSTPRRARSPSPQPPQRHGRPSNHEAPPRPHHRTNRHRRPSFRVPPPPERPLPDRPCDSTLNDVANLIQKALSFTIPLSTHLSNLAHFLVHTAHYSPTNPRLILVKNARTDVAALADLLHSLAARVADIGAQRQLQQRLRKCPLQLPVGQSRLMNVTWQARRSEAALVKAERAVGRVVAEVLPKPTPMKESAAEGESAVDWDHGRDWSAPKRAKVWEAVEQFRVSVDGLLPPREAAREPEQRGANANINAEG